MTKLPAFASRAPAVADEAPLRRELVFVVPGRLDQLTGGYLFDRHIVRVCARVAGSFGLSNSLDGVQRRTRRCSPAWPTARRQLSTASPLPISERWWRRRRAA